MFCNKCGAQVADAAKFCNKCGALLSPPKQRTQRTFPQQYRAGYAINKKVLWLILAVAALSSALLICMVFLRKSDIYGTWTDANNTVYFTFQKDGNLHIVENGDTQNVHMFQFADDKKGNIVLQTQEGAMDMQYEISEDTLALTAFERKITLYRVDEPEIPQEALEKSVEVDGNATQDNSLYGTWTDESGLVSFTFYENGAIRISGLSDLLGADLFCFTEIDSDTMQLKADSDDTLWNRVSIHLKYEISGEIMTVSMGEYTYQLVRQDCVVENY